jgi:RNA polymerase sigma-70 factor (ECF subfamily)
MTHEVRVARLLARYGPELARHLRRLLQDDDQAQDALQDTMLRAHRAMTRLGAAVNERAWLYRIATNVALNHIRSRVRERRALERHARERSGEFHPETDGGAEETERRRVALWSRVAELPERQRVALTLRVADELEYEEIAARMGSTVEAARANVYQATRKLKVDVR